MKLFIQTPDAGGQIDGTVSQQLISKLPTTDSMAQADAVLVPVSHFGNFKFNEIVQSINKPIIILDYLEFGWNFDFSKQNILGRGIQNSCGHLNNEEYAKLDQWAKDHPAKLTFKRELNVRDANGKYKPADFLCYWPKQRVVSKEEFNNRPIEVFHCWGLSNPIRPRIHGEIFINAHDNGYNFVDGWNNKLLEKRNWVALHSPHYVRVHMSQIMEWVKRSKITLSLPGAGKKCFRHAEFEGSIMALPYDDLAWSFPWVHLNNCIRLEEGVEIKVLLDVLKQDFLYDIYLAAQENLDKYRPERYAKEYIIPEIEKVL